MLATGFLSFIGAFALVFIILGGLLALWQMGKSPLRGSNVALTVKNIPQGMAMEVLTRKISQVLCKKGANVVVLSRGQVQAYSPSYRNLFDLEVVVECKNHKPWHYSGDITITQHNDWSKAHLTTPFEAYDPAEDEDKEEAENWLIDSITSMLCYLWGKKKYCPPFIPMRRLRNPLFQGTKIFGG